MGERLAFLQFRNKCGKPFCLLGQFGHGCGSLVHELRWPIKYYKHVITPLPFVEAEKRADRKVLNLIRESLAHLEINGPNTIIGLLPDGKMITCCDSKKLRPVVVGGTKDMALDQPSLRDELCDWAQWKKITPLPFEERGQKNVVSLGQFRAKEWIPEGIFSDVAPDDFMVNGLVARGDYRQRVPMRAQARRRRPPIPFPECAGPHRLPDARRRGPAGFAR